MKFEPWWTSILRKIAHKIKVWFLLQKAIIFRLILQDLNYFNGNFDNLYSFIFLVKVLRKYIEHLRMRQMLCMYWIHQVALKSKREIGLWIFLEKESFRLPVISFACTIHLAVSTTACTHTDWKYRNYWYIL